jgi:D-alanine-D-alanine ligase
MRVGITYDLRNDYLAEGYSEEETAEFDQPDTIEAIESALRTLGHSTDRIGHARRLVERLAAGDRWDLVFNIAEGLRGFGREAQVPALLELYDIPFTFSDSLVLALTLHKGLTNHVARDLGIPTAGFAVAEREADLQAIGLPYPLFVKPVAEGTGKGITGASKVSSPQELAAACRGIWQRFAQPALIETFLPGREVTVGILGTGPDAEAIGALEIILREGADAAAYSFRNKEFCEELVHYALVEDASLAEEAKTVALAAWRGLGCRDAGRVDLRADAAGTLRFLEVNPLAGLHPRHSDLPILASLCGISYTQLIGRIVRSASQRLNRRPPAG